MKDTRDQPFESQEPEKLPEEQWKRNSSNQPSSYSTDLLPRVLFRTHLPLSWDPYDHIQLASLSKQLYFSTLVCSLMVPME